MKKGVDFIGVGCGALIVNDKNQVLLLRRTEECQGGAANLWSQPGGAIEFGEKVGEAIKREIKEELNVDIEFFGKPIFYDDIREERGVKKHWVNCAYFAKIIKGELKILEPEKHDKLEWFDLDNLPEEVVHYTMKTISNLKEHLKNDNKR